MTTEPERKRAVEWAGELLESLADSRRTKRVPLEVRLEASAILRHYPSRLTLGGWDGSPIYGPNTADASCGDSHPNPTQECSSDGKETP